MQTGFLTGGDHFNIRKKFKKHKLSMSNRDGGLKSDDVHSPGCPPAEPSKTRSFKSKLKNMLIAGEQASNSSSSQPSSPHQKELNLLSVPRDTRPLRESYPVTIPQHQLYDHDPESKNYRSSHHHSPLRKDPPKMFEGNHKATEAPSRSTSANLVGKPDIAIEDSMTRITQTPSTFSIVVKLNSFPSVNHVKMNLDASKSILRITAISRKKRQLEDWELGRIDVGKVSSSKPLSMVKMEDRIIFEKSIRLPEDAVTQEVQSHMGVNGVLNINFPLAPVGLRRSSNEAI